MQVQIYLLTNALYKYSQMFASSKFPHFLREIRGCINKGTIFLQKLKRHV